MEVGCGIQLGAHISRDIGPVSATMSLEPWLPVPGGGTEVDIPPLGSLRFSTHRGPLRLVVGVLRLNQADVREILMPSRFERAIGVIYRPDTERVSHYFRARLPDQFDAVMHIDETRALEPLEAWSRDEADLPETYPSAL